MDRLFRNIATVSHSHFMLTCLCRTWRRWRFSFLPWPDLTYISTTIPDFITVFSLVESFRFSFLNNFRKSSSSRLYERYVTVSGFSWGSERFLLRFFWCCLDIKNNSCATHFWIVPVIEWCWILFSPLQILEVFKIRPGLQKFIYFFSFLVETSKFLYGFFGWLLQLDSGNIFLAAFEEDHFSN